MQYLFVITGKFNAISPSYWSNDINTIGGVTFFKQTSSNGLQELIN